MSQLKPQARPVVIQCQGVGLKFRRRRRSLLATGAAPPVRDFWALRDISLEIREGELVGIVGRNGAGKSSLALLLTGIYRADEGRIQVNARVSRLALGIGFRMDLTGRQNIFINGAYLGFSRRQIIRRQQEIIDFAQLQDFIDEPLNHFSDGMRARLAFAIATCIEPEVLVLDESFNTGDEGFRARSRQRVLEIAGQAKAVVMISHNLVNLQDLCPRVIWLESGRLKMDAPAEEVLPRYRQFCLEHAA